MNPPNDRPGPKDLDALTELAKPTFFHERRPRKIEIKWGPKGPEVGHLTGTEAKHLLAKVLMESAQADQLRARLVQLLAGAAWREASRGVLDAKGEPAMPMRIVLPPDAVKAMGRQWRLNAESRPDGSVVIAVEPEAPTKAEEGPRVVL